MIKLFDNFPQNAVENRFKVLCIFPLLFINQKSHSAILDHSSVRNIHQPFTLAHSYAYSFTCSHNLIHADVVEVEDVLFIHPFIYRFQVLLH